MVQHCWRRSPFCTASALHSSLVPTFEMAGMKWECHAGMESAGLAGLQDADHTQGFKTVADCEGTCNGIKGCSVVNWHGNDLHCHTLTGTTTHAKFTASLRTSKSSTACMLTKSNPE